MKAKVHYQPEKYTAVAACGRSNKLGPDPNHKRKRLELSEALEGVTCKDCLAVKR